MKKFTQHVQDTLLLPLDHTLERSFLHEGVRGQTTTGKFLNFCRHFPIPTSLQLINNS